MLEFLNRVNISKETINEMFKNNSLPSLEDIDNNEENCLKIILFLEQLGITNIDDLLIYKPDTFKGSFSEILKRFRKFNSNQIADLINTDYNNIDIIWE